jgi:hypothetical protein
VVIYPAFPPVTAGEVRLRLEPVENVPNPGGDGDAAGAAGA